MNQLKMTLSGAARNRKYRERIRANPTISAAYKAKDRERKQASQKKVLSPLEAERQRIKAEKEFGYTG